MAGKPDDASPPAEPTGDAVPQHGTDPDGSAEGEDTQAQFNKLMDGWVASFDVAVDIPTKGGDKDGKPGGTAGGPGPTGKPGGKEGAAAPAADRQSGKGAGDASPKPSPAGAGLGRLGEVIFGVSKPKK